MDIDKLCSELFKKSPISFVSYFGYDLSEDVFWKCATRPDVQNARLELDYPMWGLLLEEGYYWSDSFQWTEVDDFYRSNNIANAIFVIKKQGDLVEHFVFATTTNHTGMINYYFNHLNILEEFIQHFQTAGKDYIAKLKEQKLPIFDHFRFDPEKFGFDYQDITKPFFQSETYDRKQDKIINLSSRERQVLYYSALEGKTAKEIGEIIQLSPKTIESHIDKLKVKLGAKSTKVLLRRAIEIGIIRMQTYF